MYDLAERFAFFKKPLDKKLTWMRARIDKDFRV